GRQVRPRFGHPAAVRRSEEHTSELQSLTNLVCRLLLEKKTTRASGGQYEPTDDANSVTVPRDRCCSYSDSVDDDPSRELVHSISVPLQPHACAGPSLRP